MVNAKWGAKRKRKRSNEEEEVVTPSVFVDPSPTPMDPSLLAHRPVYPASTQHFQDFDSAVTPYRWVRVHASNGDSKMKMTVMAMVGELHQGSENLHRNMRIACSLLCLRMAEWMLTHPEHSVPSSRNLNMIILEMDEVARRDKHWVPNYMLMVEEAVDRFPRLDYEMEIQAVLKPEVTPMEFEPTERTPKPTVIDRFDTMWDNRISSRRDAVFLVNRRGHFCVLRIDKRGKFWVLNTIGAWLDENLRSTFVLSFGSATIFSHDDQPHELISGLSSAEACRLYFRDYLGLDRPLSALNEDDVQFAFYPIFLKGEGSTSTPSPKNDSKTT